MPAYLVIIVFVLLVLAIFKSVKTIPKDYPPGPVRLPIFGSYLQILWHDFHRPHIAIQKWVEYYKSPVISFGMGHYNVVVANDSVTCREVFNNPALQGRVPAVSALIRTYDENHGFFNDDGPGWLQFRRQTLTAMRDLGFGRRSEKFEFVMEEEVKHLIDNLYSMEGKPQLVPDIFYTTMMSLIIYIMHGQRVTEQEKNELLILGREGNRLSTSTDVTGRFLTIWPWIRFIIPETSGAKDIIESSRAFEEYIRNSFKNHRNDFNEDARRDLIDFYIKNEDSTPQWAELNMILAGIDLMFPNSVACVTVALALVLLIEHPDKLRKCQADIDDVVGRGRLPSLNDRSSLPLVEATIRETLRLEQLVPLGVGHRATEDTTLGGYAVPMDTIIFTNLSAMNTDPNLFEDPHAFRPERFVGPGAKDPTLPFGVGKRVCAGETYARQNMFVILASIIQNFDMELVVPRDPKRFVYGVTSAPNPDLSIRFLARS